jgi:hypothetical protein
MSDDDLTRPLGPSGPVPPEGGTTPYGQPQGRPGPYAPQQPVPYGQPGPYAGVPYPPQPPTHPSATLSLVLSLVAVVGSFVGVTLFLAPVGWVLGSRALREIDANPQQYSGRDTAMAGKVIGIIGTILLVLSILAVVAFIAFFILTAATVTSTTGTSYA